MHLNPGDTIAIVATARKIQEEQLLAATSQLTLWGFKVIHAPHLLAAENQFAGNDEQRAADLQWAISHPEVRAILCARGGYGTMRLMDKVDLHPLRKNPKLLCGFSDVTVLHSALTNLGLESLHCTMPLSWPENTPEAVESVRKVLLGERLYYEIPTHAMNRTGSVKGRLVGGNLSLLYALTGTPYQLETDQCILFIEDLDEYLYHVDRMMQNLKMSGLLHNLAGLIVGGMSAMRDNEIPFGCNALEIIRQAVKDFSYPVVFDFPAGHIPDNRALLMNAVYELDVSESRVKLMQQPA